MAGDSGGKEVNTPLLLHLQLLASAHSKFRSLSFTFTFTSNHIKGIQVFISTKPPAAFSHEFLRDRLD